MDARGSAIGAGMGSAVFSLAGCRSRRYRVGHTAPATAAAREVNPVYADYRAREVLKLLIKWRNAGVVTRSALIEKLVEREATPDLGALPRMARGRSTGAGVRRWNSRTLTPIRRGRWHRTTITRLFARRDRLGMPMKHKEQRALDRAGISLLPTHQWRREMAAFFAEAGRRGITTDARLLRLAKKRGLRGLRGTEFTLREIGRQKQRHGIAGRRDAQRARNAKAKAAIVEMLAREVPPTTVEIAHELNRGRLFGLDGKPWKTNDKGRSVRTFCGNHGVRLPKRHAWVDEARIAEALAMHDAGATNEAIGRAVGVKGERVGEMLNRRGRASNIPTNQSGLRGSRWEPALPAARNEALRDAAIARDRALRDAVEARTEALKKAIVGIKRRGDNLRAAEIAAILVGKGWVGLTGSQIYYFCRVNKIPLKRRIAWDDVDVAEMVDLRRKGKEIDYIAGYLRTTKKVVEYHLAKATLKPRIAWDEVDVAEMVDLRREGKEIDYIARLFGTTKKDIEYHLVKANRRAG
jgi:hypothetical protein